MKLAPLPKLIASLALIAITTPLRPAFAAEATNQPPPAATVPGASAQPAPARPTGIEIVPSLERPKNARKLEEKDFGGYLMVYFKNQTQYYHSTGGLCT